MLLLLLALMSPNTAVESCRLEFYFLGVFLELCVYNKYRMILHKVQLIKMNWFDRHKS